MQSGSLLLNSNSLKDLLMGVSDVRKRKIAAAKSEELVGAILKKDAVDGEKAMKRMRIRAAKKKAVKKRSLLDRSVTATGLQRARLLRLTNNNIFEYALDTGLDRDSVEYLERQFGQSRAVVIEIVNRLKMGFEQLSGPEASNVSASEANLLITLLGIELENKNIIVDGVALPVTADNQIETLEQDSLFEPAAATNVDNSQMDVVDSGPAIVQQSVKFNKFVRVLENFIRNKLMTLHLGEMNGYAPRYSTDRFLNQDSVAPQQLDGMGSTLFGNTSTTDLEMGGQMDESLYDTAPAGKTVAFQENNTSDLHNMFVSSVMTLNRPTSGGGGDYSAHATMSTMPRMRVENDSNVFSQSEKDILPPLRLGRNLRKQRKELGLTLGKKHFTKAGFDASFTRSTPRVLQAKPASKDILQGGGATQAEIDALRWELTVAREGIKHLDKMVDTNIAWVQTNCDMSSMAGTFSSRTKQKCRNMATERIVAVYSGLVDNTLYWAVRRWQAAVRYDRLTLTVKKFSKLKAVELLTNTLWDVAAKQMYYRGWQPWLRFVQAQILRKLNAAALQIQRIVRGRLGRVKFNKVKLGQVAVTLQKLFRKTKAIAVIKEKRFVREQELNNAAVRAIQKMLSNLIRIRLAKAEANRLREHRASVRIQKIHRGRAGRKEFLQKYLKKQHAELQEEARGGGDLENLAAHTASPTTTESAVHDTHKRSLFHTDSTDSADAPVSSPKTRLKSAPAKKPDKSPQRDHKARRSLDGVPAARPQTPDTQSAASATGSVHKSAPRSGGASGAHGRPSKSPVQSAGAAHAAPAKTNVRRAASPNTSTAHPSPAHSAAHGANKAHAAHPAHGKAQPAHGATSKGGNHSHEGVSAQRKSLNGKTPSNPGTPAASRPPSARNASAGNESPGHDGMGTPSGRIVEERNSPETPAIRAPASAPLAPPTVESVAYSEKLHAESADEDVMSSEAMMMMLQRQNSAKKIQGLMKSKTKAQKVPSMDANDASEPSARTKATRTKSDDGVSVRNSTKPPSKSTRVPSTSTRGKSTRTGPSRKSVDSANPTTDAVTSIQKLARGKLARARSKKLLEDREQDSQLEGNADSSAPGVMDGTEGDLENSTGDVNGGDYTSQDGLSASAASAGASVGLLEADAALDYEDDRDAEQEQERDSVAPMRPVPLNITQPSGLSQVSQNSLSRESSTPTKPSTPLGSMLSGNFLTSFRIPGFSSAHPGQQTPPDDRPRSSSFFRNPFSGWGSRGNSRETTPVRQRPATTGAESEFSFQRPEPIVEKPEVVVAKPKSQKLSEKIAQPAIPEDVAPKDEEQAREEASVALIQSRARGMLDRKRVAEIKEQRAPVVDELLAAEEAAEEISALVSAAIPSIPGPRTPKAAAQSSKLSKTATSPIIPTAPLPAEALTAKPGSASVSTRPNAAVRRGSVGSKDKDKLGGGFRRASFDKEDKQSKSPSRRSSFDKEGDRSRSGSPATVKDAEKSASRLHNRGSFDREGEKSSGAARRGSFDKTGGSTHQSGAKSVHVGANAGKTGATGARRTPEAPASRRTSAPADSMNAPAATASANACEAAPVESIAEVASAEYEHEDQLAPLPSSFANADVDHSDTVDFSGTSALDYSLPAGFADASAISEGNDQSDMSGFDNPDIVKSGSASDKEKRINSSKNKAAAAADKDRAKKEKEDAAKNTKDKAAQKKKEAEDKRKADAAKAKAVRDEREASKHKPAAAGKTDKSETSKHAKPPAPSGPAPPKKLDSKSNSAASKVGDSDAAQDGEEGDDDVHRDLPKDAHDDTHKRAITPKDKVPTPRSNPPTPKGAPPPKLNSPAASKTKFTKPNMDPSVAAQKIQNRARIKVSSKKVQSKKEEVISAQKKLGMLIHWAVVTIQRNFRGRRGRKRFVSQMMAKQVELAQKKEESAQLIQARARGIVGRKKVKFIQAKVRQEKQEIEWMESYQKGGRKIDLRVPNAGAGASAAAPDSPPKSGSTNSSPSARSTKAPSSSKSPARSMKTPTKEADDEDAGPDFNSPAAILAAKQAEELNERIRKLEEIEQSIREKEERMAEYARKSEEQTQAMQKAILMMQEQAKKQEDDRLAQQQLLAMAAGPMSHRSDYASPFSTQQRRAMGTGGHNNTMPMSSRRSVPNSARHPEAPPTARSARGGAAIPPDAAHITYNGEDWVQLWDPDEAAYYWYCERTQFAQWDEPGAANNASSVTIVANYLQNVNEADDSGYESAGAMTDWSTDHDDQSAYTTDSEFESSVWQEFWDESAQAKYWYNNNTGEASWTRPESALTNGGSEDGSQQLAITNGVDDASAAGGSANEWVSYIDEDTEQAYWYNVRTGETSWA